MRFLEVSMKQYFRPIFGLMLVAALVPRPAAGQQAAQTSAPEIQFDSIPDFLRLPPGTNFGEVPGVAVDSKHNIYVFSRSGATGGPAYGPTAAQLLEFGPDGEFIREIGRDLYGWAFAHSVRIDKDDNIWAIDKGSDMIIKLNQSGRVQWVFGRPRNRPTAPSRGSMSTRHCRRATAASGSRPMWRGTRKATSTSPMATSIRASPSTTRTATG